MTRLEELTLRANDEDLSEAEQDELERLAAPPEGRAQYLVLMNVESALRAQRQTDVAAAVLQTIHVELENRTVDAVIERVKYVPAPHRPQRKLGKVIALGLGLGALAFAALWQGDRSSPAVEEVSEPSNGAIETPLSAPTARPLSPSVPHMPTPPVAPGAAASGFEPVTNPVVFSFDFEDGATPDDIRINHAVLGRCPDQTQSQYCLIGGFNEWAPKWNAVMLETFDAVLGRFNRRQVLHFDYLLGLDADPTVVVQMKDRDQRQNHKLVIEDAVLGAWAHATVRVAELSPNVDRNRIIEDGDSVHDFTLLGGRFGKDIFLVDNLRLVEYPSGPLP